MELKVKLLSPRKGASKELSPQVLAYVGDALFELYLRAFLVERAGPVPPADLHRAATSLARARGQASLLRRLTSHLGEEESRLVKRGRNTGGRVPRGADVGDYRHATGLETLLGALFLEGKEDRLQAVMEIIFQAWEEMLKRPEGGKEGQ